MRHKNLDPKKMSLAIRPLRKTAPGRCSLCDADGLPDMKASKQDRKVYSEPYASADRRDLIEQMPVKDQRSSPVGMRLILAKAAEEFDLEWPEFLSVQRIKSNITEIALWLLLLAGTAVTGLIYFWATTG